MRTFDCTLFDLYNDGHIAHEEAFRNASITHTTRVNLQKEMTTEITEQNQTVAVEKFLYPLGGVAKAQITQYVPWKTFGRIIGRYGGNKGASIAGT